VLLFINCSNKLFTTILCLILSVVNTGIFTLTDNGFEINLYPLMGMITGGT
jgi:hypothetical protein